VNSAHQATTLAVEIGVNLLLESGLIEVTTADGNTKSNSLLLCLSSNVLVYGNGRVDTTALTEEGSDCSARSFRRDKDDIDVRWNLDFGKIFEDWGETVREVQCL
jgi:hypothetical protein